MRVMCINDDWYVREGLFSGMQVPAPVFGEVCNVNATVVEDAKSYYRLDGYGNYSYDTLGFVPLEDDVVECEVSVEEEGYSKG